MKSGKLRLLATWGAKRTQDFPDVPTLSEFGHDNIPLPAWTGLFVPVGTPAPPDADTLDATTRDATAFAASQWDLDALATSQPVWQPDPAALQLRPCRSPSTTSASGPGATRPSRS